ncbi:MAG: hypothetical protein ACI32E_02565 [Bacilli bacterium]
MKKSIIIFLLMLCLPFLFGCRTASCYTKNEHIKRVSKLIEERYFKDDLGYEDYELYPVYDESDKLQYFVVDFKPTGYLYILIREADLNCAYGTSMYIRYDGKRWNKYELVYDDKSGKMVKQYEVNEIGIPCEYSTSHYASAGITKNEKRYLLYVKQESTSSYIPAVKRGDKYLNLISMKEFTYERIVDQEQFEVSDVHFIPNNYFDL